MAAVRYGKKGRPRVPRRPAEVGEPTLAGREYARVRQAWIQQRRRRIIDAYRCRAPVGLLAAAATTGLSLADVIHLGVTTSVLAAVVVWAAWPLRTLLGGYPGPVVAWRAWNEGRQEMVRALRVGLDGHWLLAWDQEVPGWNRAVTIAVGPSGIWALWGAEPGYDVEGNVADTLGLTLADAIGADLSKVCSWAGRPWAAPDGLVTMMSRLVCDPVRLDQVELREWTERIKDLAEGRVRAVEHPHLRLVTD